jgi:predicted amidohydrolase YtcJ
LLVNGRVITLDQDTPDGEAVAAWNGRILAVGALADLRELIGPDTEIVDAQDGIVLPGFHDAHLHLLSYARFRSGLDCRGMRSLAELGWALGEQARRLPRQSWIRARGYDEMGFAEQRHLDRHDLDAVVPNNPVRLQHRTLHLDVLNTVALRKLQLLDTSSTDTSSKVVEREPHTGMATGRLYHAADLLRRRLPSPTEDELVEDVRQASAQLLAWGVTSVQDASVTNGAEEWALFHRLAARGALGVRLFFLPGVHHWQTVGGAQQPHGGVRRGPVKMMLDEATSTPAEVSVWIDTAHTAGHAVALHAVSEAELAIALEALRSVEPARGAPGPDRIEHGAVIPDAFLNDLRRVGVTVVGQPALIAERGDVYRSEYPPELYSWLHRAGSLLAAGVPYAIGSDAPVTDPSPMVALAAARQRRTPYGAVLGADEALGFKEAVTAMTLGPSRAVGMAHELGHLRPGAIADMVVLDPEVEIDDPQPTTRSARLTIVEGRIAWRRPPS